MSQAMLNEILKLKKLYHAQQDQLRRHEAAIDALYQHIEQHYQRKRGRKPNGEQDIHETAQDL